MARVKNRPLTILGTSYGEHCSDSHNNGLRFANSATLMNKLASAGAIERLLNINTLLGTHSYIPDYSWKWKYFCFGF